MLFVLCETEKGKRHNMQMEAIIQQRKLDADVLQQLLLHNQWDATLRQAADQIRRKIYGDAVSLRG